MAYIADQEQRHKVHSFHKEFRAILIENGIECDERYVWDWGYRSGLQPLVWCGRPYLGIRPSVCDLGCNRLRPSALGLARFDRPDTLPPSTIPP